MPWPRRGCRSPRSGWPKAAGNGQGRAASSRSTTRGSWPTGWSGPAPKLEYTPLATAFVAEEFTISELRAVYETVWGERLHAGNFHRKVLSVPGFVESTGETTETGGPRGGPRARLYRRGDARLLHPALLRPGREDSVR
jgi:8-oxo-dGTP diphosphatase